MDQIGIAIAVGRESESLATSLALTLNFTPGADSIVVADDSAGQETPRLLHTAFSGSGVLHCHGRRRGEAWNKNRALFYLHHVRKCDYVILLEGNAFPTEVGWETKWIEGARRHGHMHLAASWSSAPFRSGTGTADDPFVGPDITTQCTAFSREALAMVGFMDTRLPVRGYPDAEHSYRMVRAGYGGVMHDSGAVDYYLIDSPIAVLDEPGDGADPLMLARGEETYHRIRDESIYRRAWREDCELEEFRNEMRSVAAV